MGLNIVEGQTPIDPEEYSGLKIKSVTTQSELNEFEQNNIEKALQWLMMSKFRSDEILSEQFILTLHKKMFQDIWKWAGNYRTTNKNIGVDKFHITSELIKLFDDCRYWIENKIFSEEEIAIRFKHRLVKIHLFPNGNGRHSRIVADVIIAKVFNQPEFSWGRTNLYEKNDARRNYINALKKADAGDYEQLLFFARS